MKKIFILAVAMLLASTSLFAEYYGNDFLIINSVCKDTKMLKEVISKGGNRNMMVGNMSLYAYATTQQNCDESAEYLKSIGALDIRNILDIELIDNVCNVKKTKELISKGADKNVIAYNGWRQREKSLYTYAATQQNCGESAEYLSSIGAEDIGGATAFPASIIGSYPYNKTFEDKRLKVTMNDIGLDGCSKDIVIENKDKDTYFISSITVDINGEKYIQDYADDFGYCSKCLVIYGEKNKDIDFCYNNQLKYDDQLNIDKFPKVVKNKVSFERQVTIKYRYRHIDDGKTYELKSPKMKENIDVKPQKNYTYDPFLF
jgi:hypothetical protein